MQSAMGEGRELAHLGTAIPDTRPSREVRVLGGRLIKTDGSNLKHEIRTDLLNHTGEAARVLGP